MRVMSLTAPPQQPEWVPKHFNPIAFPEDKLRHRVSTSLGHTARKWQDWDLDTPAHDDQVKRSPVWPLRPGVPLVSASVMFSILLEASLPCPTSAAVSPPKNEVLEDEDCLISGSQWGQRQADAQWVTRMQHYQEVLGHILGSISLYIISSTWTINGNNTSLSELALPRVSTKIPYFWEFFQVDIFSWEQLLK